jgi:hypothetical protein
VRGQIGLAEPGYCVLISGPYLAATAVYQSVSRYKKKKAYITWNITEEFAVHHVRICAEAATAIAMLSVAKLTAMYGWTVSPAKPQGATLIPGTLLHATMPGVNRASNRAVPSNTYRFSQGLVTGRQEVLASWTMGAAAAQLLQLYYIPWYITHRHLIHHSIALI